MAGPINIGKISAIHKSFVIAHTVMVEAALTAAGEFTKKHVKNTAPFKRRSSSSAKDATEFRIVRTGTKKIVRIRNKKRHAKFLEFGTAPHPIRAKNARALRFKSGGTTIFRRSVKHPGTPATRFLWNATKAGFAFALPHLRTGMRRIAKRF